MPRREDIKKANVILDRSLSDSLDAVIKSRNFSNIARDTVKRFISSFGESPEESMKRMRQHLPAVQEVRDQGFSKRFAVEFPLDDLSKVAKAQQYLRRNGLELSQQELIFIILIEWAA